MISLAARLINPVLIRPERGCSRWLHLADGPADAAERHDELIREQVHTYVVTGATLVDTGPVVALLNRNHAPHKKCADCFQPCGGFAGIHDVLDLAE